MRLPPSGPERCAFSARRRVPLQRSASAFSLLPVPGAAAGEHRGAPRGGLCAEPRGAGRGAAAGGRRRRPRGQRGGGGGGGGRAGGGARGGGTAPA